jgi:ribosome maturation factor RimP
MLQIARAQQITPTFHSEQLTLLRETLKRFQDSVASSDFEGLRIRDWWIVVDEGVQCLEIFVDKGHIAAPKSHNSLAVNAQINIESLGLFHAHLIESDVLNPFADSLEVRIGTPGGEPFLRDPSDFAPWIGSMLKLETWTRSQNRDTYVMLLARATLDHVELQEGSKSFMIPLHDVKFAQALPFHSESFAKPKRKNSQKS